jgi:hypothetical protein
MWLGEQAYNAGKTTALCQSGPSHNLSLNAREYLPVFKHQNTTVQIVDFTLFTPCNVDNKFTTPNQQVHEVLP